MDSNNVIKVNFKNKRRPKWSKKPPHNGVDWIIVGFSIFLLVILMAVYRNLR